MFRPLGQNGASSPVRSARTLRAETRIITRDPRALAPEEIDRRIAERVSRRLRHYDGITQRGMTSLPKYLREALRAETRIITRDNPIYVE